MDHGSGQMFKTHKKKTYFTKDVIDFNFCLSSFTHVTVECFRSKTQDLLQSEVTKMMQSKQILYLWCVE